MSIFDSVGSWFSDAFSGGFDTSWDVLDLGGTPEAMIGGGFFDGVGNVFNQAKGLLSPALGAAGAVFGGAGNSGVSRRSSNASYQATYPSAQGGKAPDARSATGLRSVDPESLARSWYSKMDTMRRR